MSKIVVAKRVWICLLCDAEYTHGDDLIKHLKDTRNKSGHGKDLSEVLSYPNHITAITKQKETERG